MISQTKQSIEITIILLIITYTIVTIINSMISNFQAQVPSLTDEPLEAQTGTHWEISFIVSLYIISNRVRRWMCPALDVITETTNTINTNTNDTDHIKLRTFLEGTQDIVEVQQTINVSKDIVEVIMRILAWQMMIVSKLFISDTMLSHITSLNTSTHSRWEILTKRNSTSPAEYISKVTA